MTEQTKDAARRAIYKDADTGIWYWTSHAYGKTAGPFKTREEARTDFRQAMEEANGNQPK